jgi:hypothetical protein
MKKVLSLVAAGAILLSVAGVVMANGYKGGNDPKPSPSPVPTVTVVQSGTTTSSTSSTSSTGSNGQTGSGTQEIVTGNSVSYALSLTGGNVNVAPSMTTGNVSVSQGAITSAVIGSSSTTGGNQQVGVSTPPTGHKKPVTTSSQYIGTGTSGSYVGSATVSNVNVSF